MNVFYYLVKIVQKHKVYKGSSKNDQIAISRKEKSARSLHKFEGHVLVPHQGRLLLERQVVLVAVTQTINIKLATRQAPIMDKQQHL